MSKTRQLQQSNVSQLQIPSIEESIAAGMKLQKIKYDPCGCELTGLAPLPKECPTHGGITTKKVERQTVHVAVILDESGSMESCRQQTIDGFNEYFRLLKQDQDVDYLVSLTKFDACAGSPTCREVFSAKKVEDVLNLDASSYSPRGGTPMYDAIGQTVNKIDGATADKFLVVILTDGEENSSTEFDKDSIKKLIATKETLGNWTFVYLGANQDAWAEASKMGIHTANAVNYSTAHMGATMCYTADATRAYAISGSLRSSNFFQGNKNVPLSQSDLGSLGGRTSSSNLSGDQLHERAAKAAQARWHKKSK